jgi:hypothetical protein
LETVERRRSRLWSLNVGFVTAGVVVALGWLIFTVHAPVRRLGASFDDDAYYYFGVARNLAHGLGSSFNGIDATNGYHPLWLLVLTPIWKLASGRSALVLVRVLSGVLFCVSLYLLAKISLGLQRPASLVIGAAPVFLAAAAGPAHSFSGMESTVLVPCVLAILLVFVRTGGLSRERVTPRVAWGLGALLALTCLARLDAVFLVAIVVLFVLWQLRHTGQELVQYALGLMLPTTVTLIAYALLNELWFGTATPVSGQAKALGANGLNWKPLQGFLKSPVFLGHSCWLGLAVLVTVPLALASTRRSKSVGARGLARGVAVVLVAEGLMVLYYTLTLAYPLGSWYFASTEIVFAGSVAALLDSAPIAVRVPSKVLARAAAVLLVVAVLVVAGNLYRLDRKGAHAAVWMQDEVTLANQLNQTLPRDAVVAMGNRAGVLSYYLKRPIVQTEGLVNSTEYLEALRHGDIGKFLNSRHVSIYVRSEFDQGTPASTPGCTRFMEPFVTTGAKAPIVVCADDLIVEKRLADGSYERVWRYRPQLNP